MLVVVDRAFSVPTSVQKTWEDPAETKPKMRRRCAYVSLDRRRSACLYEAPDVDAVRGLYRDRDADAEAIWEALSFREQTGTAAPRVGDRRCIVLLHREFPDGVDMETLARGVEIGRFCFEAHRVAPVDSYVRRDGKASLCKFAAPDAESVRRAIRTLQVPVVRAWSATAHVPEFS